MTHDFDFFFKTSLIDDISKNERRVHGPIQRIRHKDDTCMEVQDVTQHVSKDHNQNQISLDKLDTHTSIRYRQRYHISP